MLHNHNCRVIEFGQRFKRRIRIVQVIIGKLLALNLPRSGNARTRGAIQVERRRLMRVFAIAQCLAQ